MLTHIHTESDLDAVYDLPGPGAFSLNGNLQLQ